MNASPSRPTWIYVVGNLVIGGSDQILLMHAKASRQAGCHMVILSLMPTNPAESFGSKLQAMGVEVDYANGWIDRSLIKWLGLLILPFSFVMVALQTLLRSRPAGLKATPAPTGDSFLSRVLGHASLCVRGWRLKRRIKAITSTQQVAGIHVMHAMACIALKGRLADLLQRKIYTEILTPQSYFNWGYAIQDCFQHYDELTVPSEMIWKQMTDHFTLDRQHRVIPFTVPVNPTPEASAVHPDRFNIGMAARLNEEKGHRHLLAAMPAVLQQHPQAHLILAGDGSEMEALKAQARDLNIEKHVEFLGRYDPSQLNDIMSRIDVYVLPSRTEGMPQSLIEAMAYRKPIVATPVGAVPELIEDGVNGRLVPYSDSEALALRINELLGNPALRESMGSQAREVYLQRYEDRHVCELIAKLQSESL